MALIVAAEMFDVPADEAALVQGDWQTYLAHRYFAFGGLAQAFVGQTIEVALAVFVAGAVASKAAYEYSEYFCCFRWAESSLSPAFINVNKSHDPGSLYQVRPARVGCKHSHLLKPDRLLATTPDRSFAL